MLGDSTNQRRYDIMAALRRFDYTSYALSPDLRILWLFGCKCKMIFSARLRHFGGKERNPLWETETITTN